MMGFSSGLGIGIADSAWLVTGGASTDGGELYLLTGGRRLGAGCGKEG
jgi:hypothetical protein